jgi:hypothetical protein
MKAALDQPSDSAERSYRTLRTAIGCIGFLLPFVVQTAAAWPFRDPQQKSISAYYYTGSRDLFVGMLWAIGIFMLCYKGPQLVDEITSAIAGVFAIFVALFPTAPDLLPTDTETTVGNLHYAFAAVFFGAITYMSLFLFTRSTKPSKTKRKERRNLVYRVCGSIMAASVVTMLAVRFLVPEATRNVLYAHRLTYWLETAAIASFGFAWLTKGEVLPLLKDLPGDEPPVAQATGAPA